MTRDEALAKLIEVSEAMSAQHAGQPERLHQLESHLSTAGMAIGHLFDHSENTMADAEVKG